MVVQNEAFVSLEPTNVIKAADGSILDEWCDGPTGRLEIGDGIRHECVDYECDKGYMSITGVGYNAFVYSSPDCYLKKQLDCCYQLVKRDHRSAPCNKGEKVQCPQPAPTQKRK
ncbi:hypothetical protein SNE40_000503 [Patella caerulea]|uniref:Uncharacterized protein n=1 Tax=Patella caerulea TaxID=87958 RepID=A0AAN8Q1L3_PATCE